MLRDLAYLYDIVDSAQIPCSYIDATEYEAFCSNQQLQDACIRRLEIIGEAARGISSSTKARYPDFPWRQMTGMRNLMIHEYESIDLDLIWDTIK